MSESVDWLSSSESDSSSKSLNELSSSESSLVSVINSLSFSPSFFVDSSSSSSLYVLQPHIHLNRSLFCELSLIFGLKVGDHKLLMIAVITEDSCIYLIVRYNDINTSLLRSTSISSSSIYSLDHNPTPTRDDLASPSSSPSSSSILTWSRFLGLRDNMSSSAPLKPVSSCLKS